MSKGTEIISGFAPVKDGQLYYEVVGTGQPLVLIHASCADRTMWDEQMKAFAPHYRVIRYDRRGFGKTTAKQLVATIPFFDAEDLRDLLQHLEIEKAHVLGLSGGGMIASDFALAFPDKISALIMAASNFSGAEFEPTPEEEAEFAKYMKLLHAKEWEQLAELGAKTWVDGPHRPPDPARQGIREQVYHWLMDIFPGSEGDFDPRAMTPPAAGRLGQIKVPTLVMWGDEDERIIPILGEILAREISGVQKIVFKDTAHMLNLERPAQFNQAVLNFLENLA